MRKATRGGLLLVNAALVSYLVVGSAAPDPSLVRAAAAAERGAPESFNFGGGLGGFQGGFGFNFGSGIGGIGGFNGINGFQFGGGQFGGFGQNFGAGIGGFGAQGGGFNFGGWIITTNDTLVAPGQIINLSFGWGVPEGDTWQDLKTLQLRLSDDRGVLVLLRWDEKRNRVSLIDPQTNQILSSGTVGSRGVLKHRGVKVHLARTSLVHSGQDGTDVIVNFALSFSNTLLDRTLTLAERGTDDEGNVHPKTGFKRVGQLTIQNN